jgi:hypothetical protein
MEIAPINQGHLYGYVSQTLGCVKSAEASTNDNNAMGLCHGRIFCEVGK